MIQNNDLQQAIDALDRLIWKSAPNQGKLRRQLHAWCADLENLKNKVL